MNTMENFNCTLKTSNNQFQCDVKSISSVGKSTSNNNVLDNDTKIVLFSDLDNVGDSPTFQTKDSVSKQDFIFQMSELKESIDDELVCDSSDNSKDLHKRRSAKTSDELHSFSLEELKTIADNLAATVKEVSSELVHLLQENDMLQQESDARNIVIEQLLQLTVNQTETELRPIQMSVVIPSANDDDWD